MRHLIFTLLLLSQAVSAATVWMWRDADGVVHYSDQPVPGAKQVSTSPSNTFADDTSSSAASSSRSAASASSRSSTAASAVASISYKSVAITSPAAESTISGSGGTVPVSIQLEPGLAATHHVALYLDGVPIPNYPPQALSYTLNEVPRGEHSVIAVVLDAKGNRIASSASVTFYVQQPSVLMRR